MKRIFIGSVLLCFFTSLVWAEKTSKQVTDYMYWAEKVANDEMKRNPQLWITPFINDLHWDKSHFMVADAYVRLYYKSQNKAYYNYINQFANTFVGDKGEVLGYEINEYDSENLLGGYFLFDMYDLSRNKKYISAVKNLRKQFYKQPRVNDAFVAKKIYPRQIWLESAYYSLPFYARYGAILDEMVVFDDIHVQFRTIDEYTKDGLSGLNVQAWDEQKNALWADRFSGRSANSWSRSVGLYMLSIVDVLEYFPVTHEGRPMLFRILQGLAEQIVKYQDKETGMWYQVPTKPKEKGNFLESSGTALISYALAKGANKGYVKSEYIFNAKRAVDGLIANTIQNNVDGTVSIDKSSVEAGLVESPAFDSSLDYYVNLPIRLDDRFSVGPFINAALELDKNKILVSKRKKVVESKRAHS